MIGPVRLVWVFPLLVSLITACGGLEESSEPKTISGLPLPGIPESSPSMEPLIDDIQQAYGQVFGVYASEPWLRDFARDVKPKLARYARTDLVDYFVNGQASTPQEVSTILDRAFQAARSRLPTADEKSRYTRLIVEEKRLRPHHDDLVMFFQNGARLPDTGPMNAPRPQDVQNAFNEVFGINMAEESVSRLSDAMRPKLARYTQADIVGYFVNGQANTETETRTILQRAFERSLRRKPSREEIVFFTNWILRQKILRPHFLEIVAYLEGPKGFPRMESSSITNQNGQAPRKGDSLLVSVTLANPSNTPMNSRIVPRLSSLRFTDFERVAVEALNIHLNPGERRVQTFKVPLHLSDIEKNKKYALGRGAYTINVSMDNGLDAISVGPLNFEIARSEVVLALVLFDPRYFKVAKERNVDPITWLNESFRRPSSVFDQARNTTNTYAGGMDQMLGIRHVFQAFGSATFSEKGDVFAEASSAAKTTLGLAGSWANAHPTTHPDHHGFDYLIGLNPYFMGGIAMLGGTTQISGGFVQDQSKSRSQMVIVHESGHVFGAPHCDPMQGYIMCAGEKAASYQRNGDFLWHMDSIKAMVGRRFE